MFIGTIERTLYQENYPENAENGDRRMAVPIKKKDLILTAEMVLAI